MDHKQLYQYVIVPVLKFLDPTVPYTEGAAELLLAIAVAESRLQFIDQLSPGDGPAYGLWQMEAPTHNAIRNWATKRPELQNKITQLTSTWPYPEYLQLRTNLSYAAAMCRLHFRRFPDPIPPKGSLRQMAELWKKLYNTPKGKGTVESFIKVSEPVLKSL